MLNGDWINIFMYVVRKSASDNSTEDCRCCTTGTASISSPGRSVYNFLAFELLNLPTLMMSFKMHNRSNAEWSVWLSRNENYE